LLKIAPYGSIIMHKGLWDRAATTHRTQYPFAMKRAARDNPNPHGPIKSNTNCSTHRIGRTTHTAFGRVAPVYLAKQRKAPNRGTISMPLNDLIMAQLRSKLPHAHPKA